MHPLNNTQFEKNNHPTKTNFLSPQLVLAIKDLVYCFAFVKVRFRFVYPLVSANVLRYFNVLCTKFFIQKVNILALTPGCLYIRLRRSFVRLLLKFSIFKKSPDHNNLYPSFLFFLNPKNCVPNKQPLCSLRT